MSEEEMKINEALSNTFAKMFTDAMKSFPFLIRIRVIYSSVIQSPQPIENWNIINELLFFDKDIHSYNMISKVTCNKDLETIMSHTSMATIGLQVAWHKETCRDCGEEFFMDYGEVEFYKGKGYTMPKRCPECRKKNKARKV